MRHEFRCLTLLLLVLLTACGTTRREQLHRVAKDWCETIRASQVIAVYPLTEDIQPGDVFLVQTPIDRQQEIYKQRGFLPLDNHIERLHPTGYRDFYKRSFLEGSDDDKLPSQWLKSAWADAPSAAFPSYAFEVNHGQGLNVGIPVQGIPVGLNLLGAQSANGTIHLKDARTIGIDMASIHAQLEEWAKKPESQQLLASYGVYPGHKPQNFLRVVTRVYLLGSIDVTLNNARSFGGGLDIGAARPVELFLPKTPDGVTDVNAASRESFIRGQQRLKAMGGNGATSALPPADPSLNSSEFDALQAGREAQQKEQLRKAQEEKTAKTDALKTLQDDLAAVDQRKKIKTLEAELEALEETEDSAETKLARLRAEGAPAADITAAEQALTAARDATSKKRDALKAEEEAYAQQHGDGIANAQGQLDVATAAVDGLKQLAPGASFRFTSASARSVSLAEDFDAPLVVGYLGFDVPIGTDGELGSPIPTHALLNGMVGVTFNSQSYAEDIYQEQALDAMYEILSAAARRGEESAIDAKRTVDRMCRFVHRNAWISSRGNLVAQTFSADNFDKYTDYMGQRNQVIQTLRRAIRDNTTLSVDGATMRGVALERLLKTIEPSSNEQRALRNAAFILSSNTLH